MKKSLALLLSASIVWAIPAAAQVVVIPGAAGPAVPGGAVGPALNFSLTPQQLQAQYTAVTARLDSALAGIASVPADAVTFGNTVKAYESATAAWQREITPIAFQSAVSPDPAVRAAVTELEKQMNAYGVALSLREDLFKQFERAEAKGEKLDAADRKLMDATLKGFRENGLALAPEQREKLKEMQTRLGELASEFGRNIDEKKDSLIVGDDGIKGLPADFVATLEKTPEGKFIVPVDEPSMVAYMRFAASGESRRAMLTKFNNRGGERNLEVLHEALGLRRDVAQLLGNKDYPTMVMKDRMAKTPERVLEFLNRVKDAVVDRARVDLADLLEMKRKDDPNAAEINAWERAYYARKLRTERYAFDTEEVKQYFPVDRVVEGTMRVYQKTLGVTFKELQGGAKWAPDVRLFEISDTKTGKRIGHFYLDLTPREGKHGHPAAFQIVSGRRLEDGSYEKPVSAMVADFPKAAPGQPALLNHGDVETFFHEFGHLMHQTLTQARYASFAGSSVALDFVEAPSQMLENFVWERVVIDELSGHWENKTKLPEELFAKMLKARTFMEGTNYAAQVAFALGDLVLHTDVPADVSGVFDKIVSDITGVATIPGTHFVGSFDHLMGGYGAGYYAYLWSQVFAADIYTLFKADGVISPAVGAKYRKEILEWGSERPEADSLRAFLGREPSEDAFMRDVRGEEPQAQAPKPDVKKPESVVFEGKLSPETFFALNAAVRNFGPLPAGVVVKVIPHTTGNPVIRIDVDGVNVYWEYLYQSESNLALLRRRWWKPLTWFAGLGAPSADLTKRFEAVFALAVEGAARVRAERPASDAVFLAAVHAAETGDMDRLGGLLYKLLEHQDDPRAAGVAIAAIDAKAGLSLRDAMGTAIYLTNSARNPAFKKALIAKSFSLIEKADRADANVMASAAMLSNVIVLASQPGGADEKRGIEQWQAAVASLAALNTPAGIEYAFAAASNGALGSSTVFRAVALQAWGRMVSELAKTDPAAAVREANRVAYGYQSFGADAMRFRSLAAAIRQQITDR